MATDPGIFESLLNKLQGYGTNFKAGIDQTLQPGPLPAGVNPAAGFSGGAGKGVGQSLLAMAKPGTAALVGGGTALLGGLAQGQELPDLIGSTVGGTTASSLAARMTPGLLAKGPAGWVAAAGLNLAAPVVGGILGQKTVGGLANALTPAANAAGGAVNNAVNPGSTSNVAETSIGQNLEIAKEIQKTLGDAAANNYLLQSGMMDKLGDLDERRARTAMRVAPVRTAGRLAEIGATGAANLYQTGAQGINQALSNITASNPYAQMLS